MHLRYWLGRKLGRNFFREPDESVEAALSQYFVDRGCEKGAVFAADHQVWSALAMVVQYHCQIESGTPTTVSARTIAALEAVMTNPALTTGQLAAAAGTTEKQVATMTDVQLIRRLWSRR